MAPARQTALVVARAHPLAGEGRVVDETDLVEPLQHGVGRLVRDTLAPQGLRQLLAGTGPVGEQPKTDLPRHRDRVGIRIELGRCAPAAEASPAARAPGGAVPPGSRAPSRLASPGRDVGRLGVGALGIGALGIGALGIGALGVGALQVGALRVDRLG